MNKGLGGSEDEKIHFNQKPIKNCKIYNLYKATKGSQPHYIKIFDQSVIQKYELEETIQFNVQILTESPTFQYPNHFLHIEGTYNQNKAIMIMTKSFQCRLNQFLKSEGPKGQKEALQIFQQILKAAYSLICAGFWHRNLRAEHFVKVKNVWKLQSIVYSQISPAASQGIDSQYLTKSEYQPPQLYKQSQFTDQQLDQRIVWDLGCILINILLGNHVLKTQGKLQKFKDKPFSFKAIEAKAGDKLSEQLKDMLGKMCHYDRKTRIKFSQLIKNGYFSKQVAQRYKLRKEKPTQKIFIPKASSISSSIRSYQREGDIKFGSNNNIQKYSQKLVQRDLQSTARLIEGRNNQQLFSNQQFKKTIQSQIPEEAEEDSNISLKLHKKFSSASSSAQKYKQIDCQDYNQIIEIFKNQIDKGQILSIGAQKFQKIMNLYQNQKTARQLIDLTIYAVNFVKTMDLCKLTKSLNQNKNLFKFNQDKWFKFVGTPYYNALKLLVNSLKNQNLKLFQNQREKLKKNKNNFVQHKQNVKIFAEQLDPQNVDFAKIKQPYRLILKLSYDLVAQNYINNKTDELAQLGMYVTFCLAIDKFYIPDQFKENFQFYFKWSHKEPSNFVSLYDFQDYLDKAPRLILVQNSRYIMQRYYIL